MTADTASSGDGTVRMRVSLHGEGMAAVAGTAVRECATVLGGADPQCLGELVTTLCNRILASSFDDPSRAAIEVTVSARVGELVVRLDDDGLPGSYHRIAGPAVTDVARMIRSAAASDVHFVGRGRQGNRAEIVVRRAAADIRPDRVADRAQAGSATEAAESPVPIDEPVEIRFMEPDEAESLARCVYRCYGYSYDVAWMYEPETIASRLRSGHLRSAVGIGVGGEIVGHCGVLRSSVELAVGEVGMAVVDPRYRGHHLFTTLKRLVADWAADTGLVGLYSEATANHPYSQQANVALGAGETGVLLGYVPADVDYVDITAGSHRGAVVLFYLKTGDGPGRVIHAPPQHAGILRAVVEHSGLAGRVDDSTAAPTLAPATRLDVSFRPDHNSATISVHEIGDDASSEVRTHLRDLCLHRVDTVYLDLPLTVPATAVCTERFEELGFFFGGVFPNQRIAGDVLRLQYLNNVEPHSEDIAVASDFGARLLSYVTGAAPT